MFGLENTKATVAESYKTEGKPIVKLATLAGQEKRLYGYLITKPNQYGQGVLLCAEDCMIALPNRYLANFRDSSDEDRELLKSGTKKITAITEVTTQAGNKTFTFDIQDF